MREKEIKHSIIQYDSIEELPTKQQELVKQARKFATQAYAPYSQFRVGCAILLENGKIVGGSNQENASFPAGICAERTALSACTSRFPTVPPLMMAIVVDKDKMSIKRPMSPCGICRQSIAEVESKFDQPIQIIFPGENGSLYQVESIESLLPLSFGSKNLAK